MENRKGRVKHLAGKPFFLIPKVPFLALIAAGLTRKV